MKRLHGCQLVIAFGISVLGLVIIALLWKASEPEPVSMPYESAEEGQEDRHFFTEIPTEPYRIPRVTEIDLPLESGFRAIWGGTGRDDRGHIWFGLCAEPGPGASAHLVEYDPEKDEAFLHGDVLSALRGHRPLAPDEAQTKIHTKIIQAADGNLYFASLDETGADFERGARPPKWGSHLWRLKLPEHNWEHLLSVDEGLIAIAGGGWHIYALGYFGHKLFHYNIKTRESRAVEVGSVGAHISRNIVSDFRNHVYVPRIERGVTSGRLQTYLVEYDPQLREVRETPLDHYIYSDELPAESHGLTAFQPMVDGSLVFATALGYLYRIFPKGSQPAEVTEIGWLHPEGQRYVTGLFTYGGKRYLLGLTRGKKSTQEYQPHEWIIRDLAEGFALNVPFEIHSPDAPPSRYCPLYGSVTRDNAGDFYVVGRSSGPRRPLVLRVECPCSKTDSSK